MKTQKVNFIALVALVIGIVTMSFSINSNNDLTFYYDSEDVSEGAFANPNNWEEGPSEHLCGTGETKPCEISAGSESELQQKLLGLNNESVLSISDNTRM